MRDPVVVYDAENNLDAALFCEMLLSAGIDAHSMEDVSQVGAWMLGLLPGIHKPQVWVEKGDVERAKPLLYSAWAGMIHFVESQASVNTGDVISCVGRRKRLIVGRAQYRTV